MDELKKCWRVPYIVYFSNLFSSRLDLLDLRVDEFEEAIMDDCGIERNVVIIHLLQRLLKPLTMRAIDLTNFEQSLLQVLRKYGLEHLFLQNKTENQWSELTMLTKLDIIYNLCEIRLQQADVEAKISDYDANDLRIEPLGIDSEGNKLWYFGDLRLYEEKPPPPAPKKKPSKPEKKPVASTKAATTKSSQQSKSSKSVASQKQIKEEKENVDEEKPVVVSSPRKPTRNSTSNTSLVESQSRRRSTRTSIKKEDEVVAVAASESNTNNHQEEESTIATTRSGRRVSARRSVPVQPPPPPPANNSKLNESSRSSRRRKEEIVADDESEEVASSVGNEEESETESNEKLMEEDDEEDDEDKSIKLTESKTDQTDDVVKKEEGAAVLATPAVENEQYLEELKCWRCICTSLEDWNQVADKYRSSKKKADQEIAKLIDEQYLPEMPTLFAKAEKERAHRLLMLQPKRTSQRLQSKFQTQNTGSESESNVPNGVSFASYFSDSNEDSSSHLGGPMTAEQDKQRRDDIAKQREERLKQRALRKEIILNGDELASLGMLNGDAENSQASNASGSNNVAASDFNIRNYFLMLKVMNKIQQCKYSWPFKDPVSEEDAPDYKELIDNPMDLSTIQHKINKKEYKSRTQFCDDLDLIVNNCLAYNGDDSFYGKLALKFEAFYKRWMNAFYPREISTSLEEKNRQLMKLINRINPEGGDQAASIGNGENSNGDNENSMSGEGFGANPGSLDESSMNYDDQNENSRFLLSDFGANGNDSSLQSKQKRRHGDKALYLQEPQFVTKRTSSGRLVKMKINTEFDYASDEEREAKKKKRETIGEHGDREGIQLKHIRNNPELENTILSNNNYAYMSSSEGGDSENESERSRRFRSDSEISEESEDDDDDEFMAAKKRPSAYKRKTNRPYTRRKDKNGRKSGRRTIKQLSDGILGDLLDEEDEFESGGEEGIQRARRGPYVSTASINSSLYEPSNVTPSGRRRLNGQMTVGQALAAAQAQKQLAQHQQPNTIVPGSALQINPSIIKPGSNLLLKVPPGSNTGTKLAVPIVNPAYKDVFDRYNQQKGQGPTVNTGSPVYLSRILSPSDPSQKGQTVKLVTVPSSATTPIASNGTPVAAPKKIFIVNPGNVTSNGQNLVKILSVSNGGGASGTGSTGTMTPGRLIMIKTQNSATNGTQQQQQQQQLSNGSPSSVKNLILNSQLSLQKALAMGAHPPPLTPTAPPTSDSPSPPPSSILQEQQSNIPPVISNNIPGNSSSSNGHITIITSSSDELATSVKELDGGGSTVVVDSHPIAVEASQN